MDKNYVIKQWLVTLIIGRLFILLYASSTSSKSQLTDTLSLYLIFFIFSLVFSIPTYLIYFLVFYFLVKKTTSIILIKIILDVIAIIGIFVTTVVIGGSMLVLNGLSYSLAIIISTLILKMKLVNA